MCHHKLWPTSVNPPPPPPPPPPHTHTHTHTHTLSCLNCSLDLTGGYIARESENIIHIVRIVFKILLSQVALVLTGLLLKYVILFPSREVWTKCSINRELMHSCYLQRHVNYLVPSLFCVSFWFIFLQLIVTCDLCVVCVVHISLK